MVRGAEGNAVVVQRLLAERGRGSADGGTGGGGSAARLPRRVAALATVRVETEPGDQLQIDFGQKHVRIAGREVRIFVLVAVLSYSRRLFVTPFLQRQADWREGIAAAFTHFGGVPRTVLGDNARALVTGRDRATGTVSFHPAYLAFCRDWDVQPRACAPYRARTKGKTEAGVKYVKRNALAGLAFASFAALERAPSTPRTTWDCGTARGRDGHRADAGALGRAARRLCGGDRGRCAVSAVVHARVVEHLTKLQLPYVAERLDAVLSDAARTEPADVPGISSTACCAKRRTPNSAPASRWR